jgi:hypothetical protein
MKHLCKNELDTHNTSTGHECKAGELLVQERPYSTADENGWKMKRGSCCMNQQAIATKGPKTAYQEG